MKQFSMRMKYRFQFVWLVLCCFSLGLIGCNVAGEGGVEPSASDLTVGPETEGIEVPDDPDSQPVTNEGVNDTSGEQNGIKVIGVIGVVTDETGRVLQEATIAVTAGTAPVPEMAMVTNEKGEYIWVLPAGTFTLTVHKDGYQPQSKEVNVTEGEATSLNFTLLPEP